MGVVELDFTFNGEMERLAYKSACCCHRRRWWGVKKAEVGITSYLALL